MTKLLEAYKKRASGRPDFDFDISSLGGISIFPPPPKRQRSELSHLANMLLDFKPSDRPGVTICFACSVPATAASTVAWISTSGPPPEQAVVLNIKAIRIIPTLKDMILLCMFLLQLV